MHQIRYTIRMKLVKRLLLLLLLVLPTGTVWYLSRMRSFAAGGRKFVPTTQNSISNATINEALQFCKGKQFNTEVAFLINMEIESGENRFFVVDLASKKILKSGLVTHGRCNQNWLVGRKYGNAVGCGCTSLGKYKIGKPYHGRFGLAYKLYGLDSTNNNAFARFVVLHSHECVPEKEVAPAPICQSDGCPTVAPAFLKELAAVIDKSERPVLLWIEGGRIKN